MSSVAGECVGDLLSHKICALKVEVYLETLPLPLARWFCFQRLILLSVPQAREQYDQFDQLEEERGRAPNLSDAREGLSEQVRHRVTRRTFQSDKFFISLGDLVPFCSPRTH